MDRISTTTKTAAGSVALAAILCGWAVDRGFTTTITFYRVFGLVALVFLGLGAISRGKVHRPTFTEKMLFVFLCWAGLTTFWSFDPVSTSWEVGLCMSAIVLYVAASRASKDPAMWTLIGWAFVVGCVIASLIVLSNAAEFLSAGVGASRASINDMNPNWIAYSIATSVPVILTLTSLRPIARWTRVLIAIYFVLAICAVLFTGSRGAAISIAASVTIGLVARTRERPWSSLIALGLLVCAAFVVFSYLPEEVQSRLDVMKYRDVGADAYFTGRLEVWPITLEFLQQHPFTGIGFGAFQGANPYGIRAHNAALSVLAETGIVGFLIYFSVIAAMGYTLCIKPSRRQVKIAGLTLFAAWLPIAMTGVWEFSPVAWLVFGWMMALTRHARPSTERAMPYRNRNWRPMMMPMPTDASSRM